MNTTNKQYSTQAIDPSVLDVLNISTDGKVVSAENWKTLWELVFKHINTLDAYCVTLEELRSEWSNSKALLDKQMLEFTSKYAALEQSFVHYGEEAPVNEHIKLWVQPVYNLKDKVLITFKELLATKDLLTNHINTLRDEMNIGFETLSTTLDNDYATVDYVDSKVVADQTYKPESENAQSGKAVAEALLSIQTNENGSIVVDQTYKPESENAQSGKAVAEAVKTQVGNSKLAESLKEQNKNGEFTVWLGTQVEYDAISEKVENCLYLITDGCTVSDFEALINQNKIEILSCSDPDKYYCEKWANGVVKAKGKYTFNDTIANPYGNAFYSDLIEIQIRNVFDPTVEDLFKSILDVSANISGTNELLGVNLVSYTDNKLTFYVFSHKEFTEEKTATITFDFLGKWKEI